MDFAGQLVTRSNIRRCSRRRVTRNARRLNRKEMLYYDGTLGIAKFPNSQFVKRSLSFLRPWHPSLRAVSLFQTAVVPCPSWIKNAEICRRSLSERRAKTLFWKVQEEQTAVIAEKCIRGQTTGQGDPVVEITPMAVYNNTSESRWTSSTNFFRPGNFLEISALDWPVMPRASAALNWVMPRAMGFPSGLTTAMTSPTRKISVNGRHAFGRQAAAFSHKRALRAGIHARATGRMLEPRQPAFAGHPAESFSGTKNVPTPFPASNFGKIAASAPLAIITPQPERAAIFTAASLLIMPPTAVALHYHRRAIQSCGVIFSTTGMTQPCPLAVHQARRRRK